MYLRHTKPASRPPTFQYVLKFSYLEDGSLEVVEPREENSGLPHGRFLRRHRCGRAALAVRSLRCAACLG
jgi:hypothetical protein